MRVNGKLRHDGEGETLRLNAKLRDLLPDRMLVEHPELDIGEAALARTRGRDLRRRAAA